MSFGQQLRCPSFWCMQSFFCIHFFRYVWLLGTLLEQFEAKEDTVGAGRTYTKITGWALPAAALLQPLVGLLLDYTAFARSNGRATGETSMCRILRCRVAPACLPGCGTRVVLIEIVGTRFMRQMVRVLVATAVREAAKFVERDRAGDTDALLRYARLPSVQPGLSVSEIRDATAPPAPAVGLCFASTCCGTPQT
jgi:hypothetical protein